MIKRIYTILFLIFLLSTGVVGQGTGFALGINLCGGELGEMNIPGNYSEHYAYPTEEEVDYFYKKGFSVVTIPFRWERIQKNLGAELDYNEVTELRKVVNWCGARGLKVILSMRNYGRYRKYNIDYIVGSNTVTRNDFSDVWNRIANAFSGYQNLYGYEMMAEPHDMQAFDWFTTAQQGINAIREADKRNPIIVSGDNFAAAESWADYSDKLKNLVDPQDKLVYNAHCYFDIDFTGKYIYSYDQNQAEENSGVKRVSPFVKWLKDNNKKGMVGAFGVPDTDIRWLKVMEVFLKYLSDNNVAANYWASGKKWNGHPLSIYPIAQTERPQMATLQQFLSESSIAPMSAEPVLVKTATPANTEINIKPIKTADTLVVEQPLVPPESFLFLPGTLLLPQPNGGLYKPTLSKAVDKERAVRVAKYNQ
jgi:endoglucanase